MSPLRRRMIEDMQIRNLTPNTQRVYVSQVVRFACHFGKSPDLLGPPEIRTYLLHLTQERRLAASSIIVTVSALRFFYHTTLKRPWAVEDDIPAGRQAKKRSSLRCKRVRVASNSAVGPAPSAAWQKGRRRFCLPRQKPSAPDQPLPPALCKFHHQTPRQGPRLLPTAS